jgi:hypothetical protein
MGVNINPAGRNDLARSINLFLASRKIGANRCDQPAVNRDIRTIAGLPRSIDDRAATYDQIMHFRLSSISR